MTVNLAIPADHISMASRQTVKLAHPLGPFVYVIHVGEFVKIGHTSNIPQRLRDLMSASPHEITLCASFPGGRPLEAILHKRFYEHHHRDEWFHLRGSLATWIADGFPDVPDHTAEVPQIVQRASELRRLKRRMHLLRESWNEGIRSYMNE